MSGHFDNCIALQEVTYELEGLPEGVTFNDLHVNQQRLIVAMVLQAQIEAIQGDKVALLCMGKVSLYDNYEDAAKAKDDIPHIDSSIYLPKGYPTPVVDDNTRVFSIEEGE